MAKPVISPFCGRCIAGDHDRCGEMGCVCFCRPQLPPAPTSVFTAFGIQEEPDGIELGVRYGMPIAGCGHDSSRKWLTRHMVCCPCGLELNRETYWEVSTAVEVLRPKVHCGRWRPGDPEDRFHADRCTARGLARLAAREIEGFGGADHDE